MKMTRIRTRRRQLQGMLVVALVMALFPSPGRTAEHTCEAQTLSGSFFGKWAENTLILRGDVDGSLTGECPIEPGFEAGFEAQVDSCDAIRGTIETTGTVVPGPTGWFLRIAVTGKGPFIARCGADGVDGRLTGGGWLYDYEADNSKANIGLVLPCQEDAVAQGDNMQINSGDATAHIDVVQESECLASESGDGGGEYFGRGSGGCNGEPAQAEWTLQDGGSYEYYSWWDGTWYSVDHPDYVDVEVEAADCSLAISGTLEGGQLTMHFDE